MLGSWFLPCDLDIPFFEGSYGGRLEAFDADPAAHHIGRGLILVVPESAKVLLTLKVDKAANQAADLCQA
ncbi:hypothetical protein CE457_04400 [Vreelandella boliviensis LC1]|uniref:Uncharacterized protein n=1 Tax=Vreelandella boliviensis LC1 TaxID=1072583 RepID=A0ABX4GDM5_9GAMM|nr:hypothetical protein CE457_04400 [Halomonas boliviensis LC1]